jgi:hypothetical protein
VLEDGLGRRGTEDDCDDAAGAPAARAGEDVGLEGPLEEFGPGDGVAGPSGPDRLRRHGAGSCLGKRRGRRRGHDAGTHPGVGGEDPEVADEVGPGGRDERGHPAEEGHRSQDEVRLSGGGGPLHPVGESSVGQGREPLERKRTAGAVVAQPLEADDVILVKPGVGVEREALDEGTAAGRPARGRARPAPWHLDAFELEDIERSVRHGLLLEDASSVEQAKDPTGHGDGECLHLGFRGPRQRVEAQLRRLENPVWFSLDLVN